MPFVRQCAYLLLYSGVLGSIILNHAHGFHCFRLSTFVPTRTRYMRNKRYEWFRAVPTETEDTTTIDSPRPSDDVAPLPEDDFFRSFRQKVPTTVQYFLRDSGIVRAIMDSSILLAIQPILDEYPSALADFLRLSNQSYLLRFLPLSYRSETKLTVDVTSRKMVYGSNPRQFLSLMEPAKKQHSSGYTETRDRLVVFVHGGAWGSGFPDMYQLVATPFLNQGCRVAVVGYRTYPTTDCTGQMQDLARALQVLQETLPNIDDVSWVGHSSGAHISALAFATGRICASEVDRFVSLAGIFDIPEHYRFEKRRGLERISPLASSCGAVGNRLLGWKENSPLRVIKKLPLEADPIPRNLIAHGALDTTVPYTSSQRFSPALKDRSEFRILPTVGHADMITDLMFGGETQDVVLDWILSKD
jgi:acetyl esterase/lipase